MTLDLTDLSFMDSSGTAELPSARHRAINEGSRLSLRGLSSSVAKELAIGGVDTVFTIARQVCEFLDPRDFELGQLDGTVIVAASKIQKAEAAAGTPSTPWDPIWRGLNVANDDLRSYMATKW